MLVSLGISAVKEIHAYALAARPCAYPFEGKPSSNRKSPQIKLLSRIPNRKALPLQRLCVVWPILPGGVGLRASARLTSTS